MSDWEHITVRVGLGPTYPLQGVWYNSHRNVEGEWADASEVPRDEHGRIVAYVALNGHGVYPKVCQQILKR